MARTPLFRELMRALRTTRDASRLGMQPLELHELRREAQRLSRRRFLQAGAAVAALPLLGRCGTTTAAGDTTGGDAGGGDGPRIVIVGGGMAGLHAAWRLQKLGIPSTIYEASKRTGGRMFTDRKTFPDGMHCELGGELIDTGHQTMHDLAAELGIELYDYHDDDPTLDHLVAHFGGQRLGMQQVLDGFTPIAAKIDEALATLPDQEDLFVYYDKPNGGEALDALSIRAWLDQIGASGVVRELLEVAYNIEYGLETDVQNVLNMLFLISTDTSKFDEFGDSDERFHTKAGNDTYTKLLADGLPGGSIELDATLRAIKARGEGWTLTFDRDATSFDVEADHVVLTLPFTRLREVDIQAELPAAKRKAIDEIGYGTNAKLMCGFSSRVWRSGGSSNGSSYTDLGYQSTWETSRLQPGDSGIITNFTGGAVGLAAGDGTPEQRMAGFLDGFDQVFPGAKAASNGKVARMHWPTHPQTLGSYSCYTVGQYTTITGVEAVPVGTLHFAGEHTNLDAQGYMEGAALSGAVVAGEIAEALGVQTGALAASGQLAQAESRILLRAETTRRYRRWKRARAMGV